MLISGLIALVLAGFLWTAYRRVEATLIRSAGERAQAAADQIAGLLDGQRSTEQLQQLSIDPDLRRFLESRTDAARETVRARLMRLRGTAARRIEVWDAAGTRLLDLVLPGTSATRDGTKALPPGDAPSVVGIDRLHASGGVVFTDSVAEIHRGGAATSPSDRLGHIRVRSTFVETPRGIFSRLVGHDALVRVGNRDDDLWTDFSHVGSRTSVDLTRPGVAQYRAPDGERRLGAVSLVDATPWAVWVDFPLATIIAPAHHFLQGMIVLALFFVGAAAALATLLAARITTPLSEITRAAAALAAGAYSPALDGQRRDEIGQLGRAFNAMAADVTMTADSLRKSEASYRRLFASNPHPMWVYDVETLQFLDVNDMAIRHYGYSRDAFLAMTIEDIRPVDELPTLRSALARLAPTVDLSGVWKHRTKAGLVIDVEISSHAVDLDGRPARVVLAHDVTERLRAERAVRESEALFRGMAETMPHVVWTARPDGRREYYNRRWFDYTGLGLDATRESGWHAVIHPDDRPSVLAQWARALQEGGGAYEVVYRLKRRDGVYRWHVGRAAPLRHDNGEIAMWVGSVTDVDDVRRAQESLEALNDELERRVAARTADLEGVNRELESFSHSVSHDLRAPLRHVQGYVEMLTASANGRLDDESRRYLTTITEATVEMGQLIDDLLAFSRIGRVQMSAGRVRLDDLAREVIDHLEFATRGRRIVWDLAPMPHVIGDPSMLKQVYANLIGNAVKYTSRGQEARIEIGCAGEEDGRTIFFVRDNGAGFDMRYVHKLFGVFQRLHRAEEFEGTGIGLATVRRIITRHGGRTWAEGAVGVGATIYFTLQATTPQSQPARS